MTRSVLQSKGKNSVREALASSGDLVEERRFLKADSKCKPDRGVLAIDRHKKNSPEYMGRRGFSSTLLSHDKDIGLILQEVDEISKNLKVKPLDKRALGKALHRSVLSAIKQSLIDRELRSLALIDDLTRLYNRRAFYALATQQLKVMRRKGQGVLLFFADVDHLKNINDTYGHKEGDLALTRAANALERTFRDSDIVARLGGDEFAVAALEASCQDQAAILRRLEDHLEKASAEERRYELSLSVGVARSDRRHALSLEDLLSKADKAMYEEKNAYPRMWMRRP